MLGFVIAGATLFLFKAVPMLDLLFFLLKKFRHILDPFYKI